MSLKNLLDKCIGKEISVFHIGKDKLFPFDNSRMCLAEMGVDGYYNLMADGKCLIRISIRAANEHTIIYKDISYAMSYDVGEKIRSLTFLDYSIYFK